MLINKMVMRDPAVGIRITRLFDGGSLFNFDRSRPIKVSNWT